MNAINALIVCQFRSRAFRRRSVIMKTRSKRNTLEVRIMRNKFKRKDVYKYEWSIKGSLWAHFKTRARTCFGRSWGSVRFRTIQLSVGSSVTFCTNFCGRDIKRYYEYKLINVIIESDVSDDDSVLGFGALSLPL